MSGSFDAVREDSLTRHAECRRLLAKSGPISSDDVHALRVATKHLRANWELLLPLLDDADAGAVRQARRALAGAARTLSGARERAVLAATLARLAAEAPKERQRQRLLDARVLLFGEAPPLATSAARTPPLVEAFERDCARWEACAYELSDDDVRERCYVRLYRRGRTLSRRARQRQEHAERDADQAAELWHRCRRWTKYLGYTLPLLRPNKRVDALRQDLLALGEATGDLHDLYTLREYVREERGARGRPAALTGVVQLIRREERRTRKACERLARVAFTKRPKRFAAMLAQPQR